MVNVLHIIKKIKRFEKLFKSYRIFTTNFGIGLRYKLNFINFKLLTFNPLKLSEQGLLSPHTLVCYSFIDPLTTKGEKNKVRVHIETVDKVSSYIIVIRESEVIEFI